jgi:hypothetical protein
MGFQILVTIAMQFGKHIRKYLPIVFICKTKCDVALLLRHIISLCATAYEEFNGKHFAIFWYPKFVICRLILSHLPTPTEDASHTRFLNFRFLRRKNWRLTVKEKKYHGNDRQLNL